MLEKLSLFKKIIGSQVTVILFCILIAVVATVAINKQIKIVKEIHTVRFQNYKFSSDLMNYLTSIHLSTSSLINLVDQGFDEDQLDAVVKGINEYKSKLTETQKEFRDNVKTGTEEEGYLTKFDTVLSQYLSVHSQIMDVIIDDTSTATLYLMSATKQFDSLNTTIKELLVLENDLSQKKYTDSLKSHKRTIFLFVFGVSIIIIIAVTLAVLVAKGISNPINSIMVLLSTSASNLYQASGEINKVSDHTSATSNRQVSSISSTTKEVEDIKAISQTNLVKMQEATDSSRHISGKVQDGYRCMTLMQKSMTNIKESTEKMETIIKTINDIATQTNLLSLNAAVEASRAGDAGKGFAVVAKEVRSLAEKSSEAAKETSELIANSILMTEEGVSIVDNTSSVLTNIMEGVQSISEIMDSASTLNNSQNQAIVQIGQNMHALFDSANDINAVSTELSATSVQFKAQAVNVKDIVDNLSVIVNGGDK